LGEGSWSVLPTARGAGPLTALGAPLATRSQAEQEQHERLAEQCANPVVALISI
jgi:hypothetical protein